MKNTKLPTPSNSTASVADARELITGSKQSNFPKINFGGSSTLKTTVVDRKSPKMDKPRMEAARSSTDTQTVINTEAEIETAKTTTVTQTDNNTETDTTLVEKEIWVSHVDPSVCLQKETTPNVECPTMTISSQQEASHNEIKDGVIATVEKTTETEEDTPLFRRKLQRVLGVLLIAAATNKDRKLRTLIIFVKKRDW